MKADYTAAWTRALSPMKQSVIRPEGICARRCLLNSAEGYFSIFKRGMNGVYQHCKEKHLHRYLAEYDFRYNHRVKLGFNDGDRAALAVKGAAGKRLTYRGLTKPNYKFKALRFLRWRKKLPKPKPKFVRYWQSRKPVDTR